MEADWERADEIFNIRVLKEKCAAEEWLQSQIKTKVDLRRLAEKHLPASPIFKASLGIVATCCCAT